MSTEVTVKTLTSLEAAPGCSSRNDIDEMNSLCPLTSFYLVFPQQLFLSINRCLLVSCKQKLFLFNRRKLLKALNLHTGSKNTTSDPTDPTFINIQRVCDKVKKKKNSLREICSPPKKQYPLHTNSSLQNPIVFFFSTFRGNKRDQNKFHLLFCLFLQLGCRLIWMLSFLSCWFGSRCQMANYSKQKLLIYYYIIYYFIWESSRRHSSNHAFSQDSGGLLRSI